MGLSEFWYIGRPNYIRVRRSRGEMYIGYGRVCVCVCVFVCVCVSVCPSPQSHTSAGAMVGCSLVVHWADCNRFRCCDNTAPNAKCQRVLVLALCLVVVVSH